MDDPEDLRLAAVRKPADDQVLADRGRKRSRAGGGPRIIVDEVGPGCRDRLSRQAGRFPGRRSIRLIDLAVRDVRRDIGSLTVEGGGENEGEKDPSCRSARSSATSVIEWRGRGWAGAEIVQERTQNPVAT